MYWMEIPCGRMPHKPMPDVNVASLNTDKCTIHSYCLTYWKMIVQFDCVLARDPFGISQNSFFSFTRIHAWSLFISAMRIVCALLPLPTSTRFVCVCVLFFNPCFSHMHKYVLLCIGELQQIKTRRLKRRNNSSNARMPVVHFEK